MPDPDDDGWVPGEPLTDHDTPAESAPGPVYGNLDAWVREHLSQLIRRRFGGTLTWCPWWWRHPEAISRLNALWQEWESARVDHTLSAWWTDHADRHLDVLMSRDNGPFMACKPPEGNRPGEHRELEPLPVEASDPRLWKGSAFSDPAPAPQPAPTSGQAPAETAAPPEDSPPPAATA